MYEKIALLRKHNLWAGNIFDWVYKRNEYTDKIPDYADNRLIKALERQRRSGKSYILRQVAKQLVDNGVRPENTLFINREFTDLEFLKSICSPTRQLLKGSIRRSKPLMIISKKM